MSRLLRDVIMESTWRDGVLVGLGLRDQFCPICGKSCCRRLETTEGDCFNGRTGEKTIYKRSYWSCPNGHEPHKHPDW